MSTLPLVVLVEDHAHTREELVESLRMHPDRIQVHGAYANAESMLGADLANVNVVLIDLHLPQMSGVSAIKALAVKWPAVRALALTGYHDHALVLEVLRAGAFGYLLKEESMERIVSAVEEAAAGLHPVSSRVAGFLISEVRAEGTIALTPREEQLARELASGKTYGECAASMHIGIGTVQDHVRSLYRKLRVNSRHEVRDWVQRNLKA